MYGHGAAPPTRSAATVITLRVLFAAAGLLSCGVLACVPLFRIAILRGRTWDWAAAWVSLPVSIVCFAVVGSLPESDGRGDIALAVILLLAAAASAYFLVVDIRLHSRQAQPAGYAPSQAPTVPSPAAYSPYGNPGAASPYAPTPSPHTPVPRPPAPQPPAAPHDAVPPVPVPPPPSPQRPAPARIDQVRAELDELSDYLRRHEGRPDGNPEGRR